MDREETVFHSEIQKGKLKESTIKPADLLFDRLTKAGDAYYCEVGLHDTTDSLQQVNEFTGLTEPVIQKSNLSMYMDEMIGDQIAKRALVRATDIPNGVVGSDGKLNMSVLGPTEFFSGTVGTGEEEEEKEPEEPPINEGLTHSWTFNEISSGESSIEDSVSGFALTAPSGTINIGSEDGIVGKYLTSDGFISITTDMTENPPWTHKDNFTCSFWMRTKNVAYSEIKFSSGYSLALVIVSGQGITKVFSRGTSHDVDTKDLFNSEGWNFVVVSGDGERYRVYLNGEQITDETSDYDINGSTTGFGFLMKPVLAGEVDLDEICFWNRVLSEEERNEVCSAGGEGKSFPLSPTICENVKKWWVKNKNPSTDKIKTNVEWNPLRKISEVGGMVAFRSGLVAIDECESKIHKGCESVEDGRISPMFPSKYGKLVSGIMSIVIGSDKDSETEVYCSGKKGEDFLLDLKNPVFLDAAETVFSSILSDDDMRFEPDGVAEEVLPSGKQTPSTAGKLAFDCEKILIRPRVSEGSDGASANIIYRATATYVPLDETKNMIRPFYGCVVLINIEDNRD